MTHPFTLTLESAEAIANIVAHYGPVILDFAGHQSAKGTTANLAEVRNLADLRLFYRGGPVAVRVPHERVVVVRDGPQPDAEQPAPTLQMAAQTFR